MPVLKWVRGEGLSQDHWLELFRLLNMPRGLTLEKLNLRHILDAAPEIIRHAEAIKELNQKALGEVTIREAIRDLELWGAGAVFQLVEYVDSQNSAINLIKEWKDIISQVGDNQCLLQSLKDSPYYRFFQDKASVWENKLADLDEYLQNLNQIQRKWVYLEPIFGKNALPKEKSRFKRVDEDFRSIMGDINRNNRILSLCSMSGLKNLLGTMIDQLQRCQKALNEYLEEKRSLFPRFYFIGDDDLLEILGQSTNPQVIRSHLKKLFQGIYDVDFNIDNQHIVNMKSLDGEVVSLRNQVLITPEVENWLGNLSNEMKITLSDQLNYALQDSRMSTKSNFGMDPDKYPSQILCLCEMIHFTARSEELMEKGDLSTLKKELAKKLSSYTDAKMSLSADPAMNVLDLKLKSLILDTVHNIDVVDQLLSQHCESPSEWEWQKQLRFYQNPKDQVLYLLILYGIVAIIIVIFHYGTWEILARNNR